ncbi:hypothetical protein NBRC116493_26090 [Aurantivibrio infirmus]
MQKEFNWKRAKLAHPGKRYQAQFSAGLISALLFFLTIYFCKTIGFDGKLADALIIAIPTFYFVFSDSLPGGQSLGKKPFRISVVSKATGKPCNIWQSFIRNVFTPILGIIDAVLIFGENRQRLGDKFVNTIVVKNY